MSQKRSTAPATEPPDISSASTPSLANLCTFSEFAARTTIQCVFQSEAAVRWFYREHRAELSEAGAVIDLCGRLWLHIPRFTAKALEIGARKAAARAQKP